VRYGGRAWTSGKMVVAESSGVTLYILNWVYISLVRLARAVLDLLSGLFSESCHAAEGNPGSAISIC
jgi:hypothetical protein